MTGQVSTPLGCMRTLPPATVALITGPVPEVGLRHDSMMEVAYRAAEFGCSNDEILALLEDLCGRWGKHPGRYGRWTALLSILRRVRSEFPNSPHGTGHRRAES